MQARRIIKVSVLLALGGLVGGCASVQIKPIAVSQVNDPDTNIARTPARGSPLPAFYS